VERQVGILKRNVVFLLMIFLTLVLVPSQALSTGDSIVIGRITGTFQELPSYFFQNPYIVPAGMDDVEFTGFRLVRVDNGKKFLIRPNHKGFFYQRLLGGKYTLVRKRTDRPGYKEPKSIDIMSFEVRSAALVNLGTVKIVIEGKPKESLRSMPNSAKGTYTYRYSYVREHGERAYNAVNSWFINKKPSTAAVYDDSVVIVDAAPTSDTDGSKKVLRLVVPRSER
jgi:hypothetical protein